MSNPGWSGSWTENMLTCWSTVWVKKIPPPPLKFSDRIFSPKFTHLLLVSYLCWTTNFYLIICNFDEVMPYYARPPSSHRMFRMSTIGRNARWHFLTFSPNSCSYFLLLYRIHVEKCRLWSLVTVFTLTQWLLYRQDDTVVSSTTVPPIIYVVIYGILSIHCHFRYRCV